MVLGCFSGKRGAKESQSQLRFLEEQNLELASALNEWQALVQQLRGEQEVQKGTIEQQVRVSCRDGEA